MSIRPLPASIQVIRLRDISLRLSGGEVIGLGGLDGQGQRELLLALDVRLGPRAAFAGCAQ